MYPPRMGKRDLIAALAAGLVTGGVLGFATSQRSGRSRRIGRTSTVGPGLAAIPTDRGQDFADLGLGDSLGSRLAALPPTCSVSDNLAVTARPFVDPKRVVNFFLYRETFLDAGWTQEQLGSWDPDPLSPSRRGLFLSMFYALQNNNLPHPWNETTSGWDRGLGAHIDHVARARRNLDFSIVVYHRVWGLVVQPFEQGCLIQAARASEMGKAFGVHTSGDIRHVMKINVDADWALGHRIDEPTYILGEDGRYRMNITYLIAHEAGHHFGFGHVADRSSIMYEHVLNIPPTDPRPIWQSPADQMMALFNGLVGQLKE
jgi:hypothetical protein